MKNKIAIEDFKTRVRYGFIIEQLRLGVVEYYSRVFSIRVDWDGNLSFTIEVVRNSDNKVIEKTVITDCFDDALFSEPTIYRVWDRLNAEFERIKIKHIIDLDGIFN